MFEVIAVIAIWRWARRSSAGVELDSFGGALGRSLNGSWLAVAVAVLYSAAYGLSEKIEVWPFFLASIGLTFVPALTLFFYRAPQGVSLAFVHRIVRQCLGSGRTVLLRHDCRHGRGVLARRGRSIKRILLFLLDRAGGSTERCHGGPNCGIQPTAFGRG
jgi:hypothetical protein